MRTQFEEYVIMHCWKRKGDDFDPATRIEIFVKVDDWLEWEYSDCKVYKNKEMLKYRNRGYVFQPQRFGTIAAVKGDITKRFRNDFTN